MRRIIMALPTAAARQWCHKFARLYGLPRQLRWMTAAALTTTMLPVAEPLPFDGHSSAFLSHPRRRFSTHPQNATTNSTLETLQTLVTRLQAPAPLRATNETTTSRIRLSELASSVAQGYENLPPLRLPINGDECERCQILQCLATKCCASLAEVDSAVKKYERYANIDMEEFSPVAGALSDLRNVTTPPYENVLSFVLRNNGSKGMGFLVSLREDLMQLLNYYRGLEHNIGDSKTASYLSQLKALDLFIQSIFVMWFSPGMLELRRITYDQTPASVIEFIATKEAVHPMKSLDDLRRRLGPKRRVFALFHPLLPDQPLVFVHIALIEHNKEHQQHDEDDSLHLIPSCMDDVMDTEDEGGSQQPVIATFYSISNGVKGLAGVGLGEHLIKRAVENLRQELPSLKVFVTLSPLPGFRKWLQVKILQHKDDDLLTPNDRQALIECGLAPPSNGDGSFAWTDFWQNLENIDYTAVALAHTDSEDSPVNQQWTVLEPILSRLACRYIALEKHRGKPLDGVCKFHVSNGAEILRVNFAADLSRRGWNNSFGMMVNYQYELSRLEENSANFESNYTVPVSRHIQQWIDSK